MRLHLLTCCVLAACALGGPAHAADPSQQPEMACAALGHLVDEVFSKMEEEPQLVASYKAMGQRYHAQGQGKYVKTKQMTAESYAAAIRAALEREGLLVMKFIADADKKLGDDDDKKQASLMKYIGERRTTLGCR